MNCLYCGESKEILETRGDRYRFSKEHILPKALIGAPDNNLFTIKNVCGVCNNRAGLEIDAPAIKSWFMQMELNTHAKDFAIIEENPVLPLVHMGKVTSVRHQDKVIESYIGPTGDTIYHVHDPYPNLNSYPAVMGVPPQLKKKVDPGFAFLFIASNNPAWHQTIVNSFIAAFKGSMLYLGNVLVKPSHPQFSEIPADLLELRESLISLKSIDASFSFTPYSENRFLAKAALGIGSKFLGYNFEISDTAINLRKYMWARTEAEREGIKLSGVNFFDPSKEKIDLTEYFGWEGGHLISLLNLPDRIGFTITLYNRITASISLKKSDYSFAEEIGHGICIAVVPALKKIIGPMRFMEFLDHKLKMRNYPHADLLAVEEELKRRKANKPPKNI